MLKVLAYHIINWDYLPVINNSKLGRVMLFPGQGERQEEKREKCGIRWVICCIEIKEEKNVGKCCKKM